jgi:hypothetical protein
VAAEVDCRSSQQKPTAETSSRKYWEKLAAQVGTTIQQKLAAKISSRRQDQNLAAQNNSKRWQLKFAANISNRS